MGEFVKNGRGFVVKKEPLLGRGVQLSDAFFSERKFRSQILWGMVLQFCSLIFVVGGEWEHVKSSDGRELSGKVSGYWGQSNT